MHIEENNNSFALHSQTIVTDLCRISYYSVWGIQFGIFRLSKESGLIVTNVTDIFTCIKIEVGIKLQTQNLV